MDNLTRIKLGFIMFILCGLISCEEAPAKMIPESSIVTQTRKSNHEGYQYWIVTTNYNFYTNSVYNVGDTIHLCK